MTPTDVWITTDICKYPPCNLTFTHLQPIRHGCVFLNPSTFLGFCPLKRVLRSQINHWMQMAKWEEKGVIDTENKQNSWGVIINQIYFVSLNHLIKIFRVPNTIFIQKDQPIKCQHSKLDLTWNRPPVKSRQLSPTWGSAGEHRGWGLESSHPPSLLESIAALPGLEQSRGRRVRVKGEQKSSHMTETVSCIYGLWSQLWFKLSFGSLENPIAEDLSCEDPLT